MQRFLTNSQARKTIDTHQKARNVNFDARRYGTLAEIGTGQEVVRWFFRVGGGAIRREILHTTYALLLSCRNSTAICLIEAASTSSTIMTQGAWTSFRARYGERSNEATPVGNKWYLLRSPRWLNRRTASAFSSTNRQLTLLGEFNLNSLTAPQSDIWIQWVGFLAVRHTHFISRPTANLRRLSFCTTRTCAQRRTLNKPFSKRFLGDGSLYRTRGGCPFVYTDFNCLRRWMRFVTIENLWRSFLYSNG